MEHPARRRQIAALSGSTAAAHARLPHWLRHSSPPQSRSAPAEAGAALRCTGRRPSSTQGRSARDPFAPLPPGVHQWARLRTRRPWRGPHRTPAHSSLPKAPSRTCSPPKQPDTSTIACPTLTAAAPPPAAADGPRADDRAGRRRFGRHAGALRPQGGPRGHRATPGAGPAQRQCRAGGRRSRQLRSRTSHRHRWRRCRGGRAGRWQKTAGAGGKAWRGLQRATLDASCV